MPNISTYSLGQMTDLVKRTFVDRKKILPQVMRNASFVVTDVMPKQSGDYKRYAQDLSRSLYAGVRDEGNTSGQAQVQYGYEKDAHPYTISSEISITKRMRDAGKNPEILRRITNLADIGPNTIDLDLAHRFSFAWSTSYVRTAGGTGSKTIDVTMGDGLSMINGAHTLTGSGTTWSNQITGNAAFSEGSLEAAEKSFVEETYDNLGQKMYIQPDTILTTDDPNTCNEVQRLLKATANVGSANSGTENVYMNKYKHVKSHRIATDANGSTDTTKRKYRFLIASGVSDMYLTMLNEPYVKAPNEEYSSENWDYLTAADYDITVVSGTWIRGSKGDGSA